MSNDPRLEAVAVAYARLTFPYAEKLDPHMADSRVEALRFLAMLDAAFGRCAGTLVTGYFRICWKAGDDSGLVRHGAVFEGLRAEADLSAVLLGQKHPDRRYWVEDEREVAQS